MNDESRTAAELRLNEQKTEAELRKILTISSAQVRGRNDDLLGKLRRPGTALFKTPGDKR